MIANVWRWETVCPYAMLHIVCKCLVLLLFSNGCSFEILNTNVNVHQQFAAHTLTAMRNPNYLLNDVEA